MFFYSDTEVKGKGSFVASKFDATNLYMKHFENSLFLTFMMLNGTMIEKHQASKELDICERKMKYWERQGGFDRKLANTKCTEARKKWDMT